ncbi:MAG: thioredoxin domain-containing protein, partial [Deltaproteobacteria bacterium]|nr:thioredoxin domain-containing protein [Deltaproteobacteria bacterium]
MKNFNVVIGVLVGAVAGYALGVTVKNPFSANQAQATAKNDRPNPSQAPLGADQVFKVPLGPIFTAKGDEGAKVTIVEFSDFECPYCGRAADTVHQVEQAYGRDVRIVYKHNPLPMHPHAPAAAKAAIAAGKQGKFREMHDKMFEATNKRQPLTPQTITQIATDLGLDQAKFAADADSQEAQAIIQSDAAQARTLGATGTPAFFINGVKLSGAQPFENFKRVIDAQMKRAD